MEKTSPQPTESKWERGFWGLIGLQFQGALSDNILKFVLVMIVLDRFQDNQAKTGFYNALFGAIFAIPFLVFAGWCGAISDRFSKRFVILMTKIAEVGIMAMAALAFFFYTRKENPSIFAFYCAIGVLFLAATQATFFSPSKYGILPEILPLPKLTWGNGVLEMTTFIAIIFGQLAGNGLYVMLGGRNLEMVGILLIFMSLAGLGAGWFIERVKPAKPEIKIKLNHFPEMWANMRIILKDRVLLLTVLGLSYFWALGSILLSNVTVWGEFSLGMKISHERTFGAMFVSPGILVAPIAIGIGLGSVLVGMMSQKKIELGFVPLGGLGITLFSLPLGMAHAGPLLNGQATMASPWMLVVMILCLTLLGVAAGFFSVPLNALLQERSERAVRGGVIAATNFANFTCIVLSMGLYSLLLGAFRFSPANVFTLCSLITLAATAYLITLLPEALLGLVATVVTRFVYRIRVLGGENIPTHGPALLVSNHVSMVDALLVMSLSPRPVRFIVWQEIFDNPILGYFLKIMRAIPVSSDQRPRAMIASLTQAADALNNGELVCIFAEGQITRTGLMLPFRRGFKHILGKAPVPVVPIYLEGVWGSIFSYERKRFIWKWPRHFPYRVRIAVGKPLPSDVSMHDMRQSVLELSADCAMAKKDRIRPVHHRFIRYARRHWNDLCVGDSMSAPIKFGRTLTGGIILARRLKRLWADQEMVGIFLPPSIGATLANVAVALSGRTAVNLNYTTGPEILRHCINQCKIKTVITSRLFLAKLNMEPPPGSVYLDDLMKKTPPTLTEKIAGFLATHFLPIRLLETFCGAKKHPNLDSLITVIFSSGSTGMPKGVMLTHFNIASNLESIEQAIAIWPDDRLIGFLPLFHSFGYTVALWASLCMGFGVIHHNNPLEPKVIGDLVEKYGITVMVATPTFLQHYIRRVEPHKFGSLEFVLTGAEKLPLRIAEAFEERFGVYVHEGYGTTECAPVVSANVDDYRSRGFYQIGNKRGTAGHPIPGVVVRIVDVDTGKITPGGEVGMIQVRGANIMKGYLGMPEKTAEVLKEGGWYETGDLGFLDDDGFIHITDRLARFSKIGGEMVPHQKIEEELHTALNLTEMTFAVTSVPDENKGERLVVLHTADPAQLEGITDKLAEAGLPNLWIPRRSMFFKVDQIPILGTGKLDLSKVRKTAQKCVEAETVPASS